MTDRTNLPPSHAADGETSNQAPADILPSAVADHIDGHEDRLCEATASAMRAPILFVQLQAEIQKWREKDAAWRHALYERQRATQREADRLAYAERILQEQGRSVRAYSKSTLERRQLQKAASRAKRKANMTAEEVEARRKKDRERKALERDMKALNLDCESGTPNENWQEELDRLIAQFPDVEPPQET